MNQSVITGTLSAIALIGGITLAALNKDAATIGALLTTAGTFGGYVIGLHNEP